MKVIVLLCVVSAVFAFREPEVQTCDEDPDPGMCLAYIPMFYYDTSSRTCKRFIYGGCQGNGNRYATEEACLKHCSGVQRSATADDVCRLPKMYGLCFIYLPRYYFDQETGQCEKQSYGGCPGNENNFRTLEECQSHCPTLSAPSVCEQEKVVGPCRAAFRRFYYNKDSGKCEKFIYGGCRGNENNFQNQDDCEATCVASRASSKCSGDPETGMCRGYFPRYYYDEESKSCKEFIYGGCGGNENNYESEEDCLDSCGVSRSPTKCTAEPETGPCYAYFPRYYYDQESKSCKGFIYGGCRGNDNNYRSEQECLESCAA